MPWPHMVQVAQSCTEWPKLVQMLMTWWQNWARVAKLKAECQCIWWLAPAIWHLVNLSSLGDVKWQMNRFSCSRLNWKLLCWGYRDWNTIVLTAWNRPYYTIEPLPLKKRSGSKHPPLWIDWYQEPLQRICGFDVPTQVSTSEWIEWIKWIKYL